MGKRRRVESAGVTEPARSSLLLKIPLELRLQIYDYALSDVTIAVAEQERNISDSVNGDEDGHIEGIPSKYVPVVKNEYDPELVMVGPPATVPYRSVLEPYSLPQLTSASSLAGVSMDSGYASAGSSMYSIATASSTSLPVSGPSFASPHIQPITNNSLLLINKQTRHEMLVHLQSRTCKQTTLYATYPYGLLVLRHHYPALLKHSKHIVITGQYTSPDPAPSTARSPSPPPTKTQLASSKALSSLTRTMYQSYRKVTPQEYYKSMRTLHMRIYYPDERKYSSIWGDDASPIVTAMQLIPSGHIECKTWRGRTANGVTMKVLPPKEEKDQGEWRRNFCSVFRRAKQQRGIRPARRDIRRSEDFWEEAFGDEQMFEALVPEEKCWNRM